MMGGQRRLHRRQSRGLHAHHSHARTRLLHGAGNAPDQPAAPDGHHHGFQIGDLFQQLQPDRSLPGDHRVVVEAVDKHQTFRTLPASGFFQSLVEVVPVEDHLRAPGRWPTPSPAA